MPARLAAFVLVALAAASGSGASRAAPPPVTLREVASGLTNPLEIAHADDGSGRLFIVEKGGRIKILKNGTVLARPFLDVSALVSTTSERGLLGLAFSPQFRSDRRFFVYLTRMSDGALQVRSYRAYPMDADLADPASGEDIITIAHPTFANHNGGHLAFGPDGMLYIGTGDGGGAGDPSNNAQNNSVLLGKMLRIEVSTPTGYVIPPDNPYAAGSGASREIYAYGLRNPWKFSFDRATQDLYIGDVGQDTIEEVDFQPALTAGGQNYGWNWFEGNTCVTFCPPFIASWPILQYRHDAAGGNSITGGYVYRGRRSAALRGYYIYGDFVSNRVWAAKRAGGTWTTEVLISPPSVLSGISSFGEDERGELYAASFSTGKVYAIDGPGPAVPIEFDLDGSGTGDFITRDTAGGATGYLMNRLAVASTGALLPAGSGLRITHAADLDGDGKADLLLEHADGSILAGTMNGLAPKAQANLLPAGSGWHVTHTGDFNGDGKADLVLTHASGWVFVLLMNGLEFAGGNYVLAGGAGWSVTQVADFNGDGKSDLLLRHTDGSIAVMLMDGATPTAAAILIGAGSGWSARATGDFNGDGKADIVVAHDTNGVFVLQMDGTAATAANAIAPAAPAQSIVVADFNGDGKSDIALQAAGSDVSVLLMDGVTPWLTRTLPAAGLALGRARDIDGDGRADLLLQRADGGIDAWLMHGATVWARASVAGAGSGAIAP